MILLYLRGGGAGKNNAPLEFRTITCHSEDDNYPEESLQKSPGICKSNWHKLKKSAFTMAEVLITIGIIGVIAAMTIYSLIGHAERKVASVQVYNFYSMINQAVTMAIHQNGEIDSWFYGGNFVSATVLDSINYDNNLQFVKTYFKSYIKTSECENYPVGSTPNDRAAVKCMLPAGDAVIFAVYKIGGKKTGISLDIYYVTNFRAMSKGHKEGEHLTNPRYVYYFSMRKEMADSAAGKLNANLNNNSLVGPYTLNWSGKYEDLTKPGGQYSCSKQYNTKYYPAWCTKLLELNGWEFPDNYPW